jgi:hypothetical protein
MKAAGGQRSIVSANLDLVSAPDCMYGESNNLGNIAAEFGGLCRRFLCHRTHA